MRRAFGLIVLVAAVGGASASMAQQHQQQQQRKTTTGTRTPAPIRRELPPAKFVPAEGYAKGVDALKAKRYKQAVKTLARVTDAAPKAPAAWRGWAPPMPASSAGTPRAGPTSARST